MILGNFKTGLSSIRNSRWRSTLTMLGIIIGICSVVTIASLGEGLKRQVVGQVNQLGDNIITVRSGKLVNKDSSGTITGINPLSLLDTSTLTDNDVTIIKQVKGVTAVSPLSNITSSVSYNERDLDNTYVVSASPEISQILGKRIGFGSYLTTDDSDRNYAVIGTSIAQQLFKFNNPVGSTFQISGTDFIVRGVMGSYPGSLITTTGIDLNRSVIIPSGSGRRITNGKSQISQILVKNKAQLADTIKAIHSGLLKNHGGHEDFTVLRQDELLSITNTIVNLLTTFISSVAAISLLVGGIGIMNIMLVSVTERTREIGIRKAIGATNRQILNQFFMEGVLLSVLGGLMGIAVSYAVNFGLRVETTLNPIISWQIVVLAAGITISLGIVFALAPAVKASRKNPIDALRNE